MHIHILSIVPELLDSPLNHSIMKRAKEKGLLTVTVHHLRKWAVNEYGQVDDYQYGGGAGMLMKPEPWGLAFDEILPEDGDCTVIFTSPAGEQFKQATAHELASAQHLVFACGRYEGIDQRVRAYVDLELSIGDFVLSGGEPAAIVLCDALLRLVPGAIDAASLAEESFSTNMLEYPQYTRPAEYRGVAVPEILLSGNHAAVAAWRGEQARQRTAARRPDLLEGAPPPKKGE